MSLIRLIDDSPVVHNDAWTDVADDSPLPEGAPAIVSLSRWLTERGALMGRNAPLGVRLASHEKFEVLLDDLERFALIALDFPSLNDGRHYTTARLLRERHGFRGAIRATGQVLRDQMFLMARCGFDSFKLQARQDAAGAQRAFDEIGVVYQPAADLRSPVSAIRSADYASAP